MFGHEGVHQFMALFFPHMHLYFFITTMTARFEEQMYADSQIQCLPCVIFTDNGQF